MLISVSFSIYARATRIPKGGTSICIYIYMRPTQQRQNLPPPTRSAFVITIIIAVISYKANAKLDH